MNRFSIGAAAVISAALFSAAFAPVALAEIVLGQTDSSDPVLVGENVTVSITATNTGGAAEDVEFGTLIFRQHTGIRAGNPYVSQTPTQGTCVQDSFPSAHGDFYGIDCDLGTVQPGETARVDAVIQMNESMTHSVYLAPAGTGADSEDTSVYYEPELSGSKKIKLRGLPDGCATRDFTVRARVRAANVRRMTATLSSPQTEWGGRLSGGRKREQVRDDQLNFEVRAETLKDAHYDLKFVATRKGAPKLKRTVEFQVC